eukprot:SAG22_NODE_2435_length_2577_cov_2.106538_2_plen_137_part_00
MMHVYQVSCKALPLPCASTVFLSKTVPFCAVPLYQARTNKTSYEGWTQEGMVMKTMGGEAVRLITDEDEKKAALEQADKAENAEEEQAEEEQEAEDDGKDDSVAANCRPAPRAEKAPEGAPFFQFHCCRVALVSHG